MSATPIPESINGNADPTAEASATMNQARHHPGTVPDSAATAAASTLVQARWLSEKAVREDVEAFFRTCTIDEGLTLLAHMRQMCELAGRTLEQHRLSAASEIKCSNPACGITQRQLGNRVWRMETSRRDPDSGVLIPVRACSDACVVALNKIKYGVAAISDRGMLPGDDPARKRNDQILHQERLRGEQEFAGAQEKAAKVKK